MLPGAVNHSQLFAVRRLTRTFLALFLFLGLAVIARAGDKESPVTKNISQTGISKDETTETHVSEKGTVSAQTYHQVVVSPPKSNPDADPFDSPFNIWLGEVTLQGRTTLWVELIDEYGEVIYDSEVHPNETHMLPDGRALVVNEYASPNPSATTLASTKDQSRVTPDAKVSVSVRSASSTSTGTQVHFIDVKQQPEAGKESFLLNLGRTGDALWNRLTSYF
ncbi:hypothetical protein [Flexibacterium corallicola]|uniref:hypothetical protein n=1 Tax=Flexibacterium corallicola TaxID=3037259 RepID=UPI00286F0B7F|nr:hypothetical protein [Pseudovibrio sp. M1P-2-3]